ncbi:PspA/IM30 family protein [Aliikangiella coralliicola]|nr:PspA/IM30 family protein [Aliikangiella coralliicola]
MNLVDKIFTSIRGGARELGEALVDSQSIRIYEQEIMDSKEHLANAKENLTEIIAKKLAAERQLSAINAEIAEHENYAVKALEKNEQELAVQIAEKIARLESKTEILKEDISIYQQSAESLKIQIQQADTMISEYERDLAIVDTTASLQQARSTMVQATTLDDSALSAAQQSLEKIKQKQQFQQDKIAASIQLKKELEGEDLEEKLKSSGIIQDKNSAEAVLARLKKSTSEEPATTKTEDGS